MARTYPEHLPDTFISPAERALFHALATGLDDAYTVFFRVAWLARAQGRAQDGEADMVLAHPRRGLLVIEVKGGRIGYDGATGAWQSVSRRGQTHPLLDPVAQARRNFHTLQAKLRESKATARYHYPGGYAVAFPDVVAPDEALRLDIPPALVLDAAALDDVAQAVAHAYDYWQAQDTGGAPGQAALDALVQLLAPTWQLRTPLRLAFEAEEARIRELTEQQYALLDFLARHRRAKVCGCAGSGKTFLAAEKARRLAAEGFRVLLTCYNANLADWLAASLRTVDGITVLNFHRLCRQAAMQAGLWTEPTHPDALPRLLAEAMARLPSFRFDAVIADEGQDFAPEWWPRLEALLRDPADGIFYIFYDDNQRIYRPHSHYPVVGAPFILPHNCRTTQRVHRAAMRYYRGEGAPHCLGPEGRSVETLPIANRQDEPRVLEHLLRRMTQGEGVPLSHIVLLTPCSRQRSRWQDGRRVGDVSLAWQMDAPDGALAVSTIHAFKGLERPVVILSEMDRLLAGEREALLYVALSRARNHLVILGSGE